MPWNPDQYHRFQQERAAPFDDLVKLITIRAGLRVIDLGCGTGELTRRLADMLPESDVLGVDGSPEMLARAAEYARAGLRFEQASIESVTGSWDLVFSHAAIQWLDDHARLIPRLWNLVNPGGQLAVQIPSNHNHITHVLIRQIADEEPYRTALDGWNRQSPVLTIEEYANLLHDCGARNLGVMEKIYPHILPDADALAEWTAGTALVPYMERLPDGLREDFMQTYRVRLREKYSEGEVFYGFRRTLFAATKDV